MKRKWIFNSLAILVLFVSQFSTLGTATQEAQATPAALSAMTCTALDPLATSEITGEKPQSKLWTYAGDWWSVLPTTSAASSNGTWLWKLDNIYYPG